MGFKSYCVKSRTYGYDQESSVRPTTGLEVATCTFNKRFRFNIYEKFILSIKFFLLSRCAVRLDSSTTNLRVVFAFPITPSGQSSNSNLHTGSTILEELFSIFLKLGFLRTDELGVIAYLK